MLISVSPWHDSQSCSEHPPGGYILHWGYLGGTDRSSVGWDLGLTETVGQLWHPDLAPVHAVSVEGNINQGAHQHH